MKLTLVCTEQDQKTFGTKTEGTFRVGSQTATERRGDETRSTRSQEQDHRESTQTEIRRERRDENIQ